ncbi:fimbrial protein [Morganella psychrotolerans]|uniref:fimbrial protein n=1 Tax=Morganella psychrotolerans TaxID=368603 RepID=UPI0039B01735
MIKDIIYGGRIGIICVMLSIIPVYAKAACTTPEPEIMLTPDIHFAEISEQLPLMARIAGPFYSGVAQGYHCIFTEETAVSFGIAAFGEKIGTTAEGHSVFYLSEGIGYSLGGEINYPGCPADTFYIDGRDSQGTDIDKIICRDRRVKGELRYWGRVAVTLHKTGVIPGSKIPAAQIAKLTLMEDGEWYSVIREPYVNFSGVKIRRRACDIDIATTREVDLGSVSRTDFSGKGSVAQRSVRDVIIGLQCSNVYGADIMLSGAHFDAGNVPGTLKLNRIKNSAKGIGIRVTRQGAPVKFNEWISFDRVTAQSAQIRLQAAFVQTRDIIEPGMAESVLHYTIRYL